MSAESPRAGRLPGPAELVDVARLVAAYYTIAPDPGEPAQAVAFGTSGHRGSALAGTFNEAHVLAVTQAVCDYRAAAGIDGPLFLGRDTHALSHPAHETALEVLAANGVETRIADDDGYTPTPAVSHAILTHNRAGTGGRADGLLLTPSHNPPQDGGIKYNPPDGGPAGTDVTRAIERRANALLAEGLRGVKRMPVARARRAGTTRAHDYVCRYVEDLADVLDLAAIRAAGLKLAVDPLGGAGVRYWPLVAERWGLELEVVNATVDPTFRFLHTDWDGQLRMDPSSPPVMQGLLALRSRFDLAFACDADHDRHGIVTASGGLLPPNHYLAAAIDYLCRHRPRWPAAAGIGKTAVSSSLIDRVSAACGRRLVEVPVGFKWFVPGLLDGSLCFGGEESAGAAFVRHDGTPWTTDKDGILLNLLAAELTARLGRDPAEHYRTLTATLGEPCYARIDAPASARDKARLKALGPGDVNRRELAGAPITAVLTAAPGNGEALGGLKIVTDKGWFAARPSGTEDVYKIYAESFEGPEHLARIQTEARALVAEALC